MASCGARRAPLTGCTASIPPDVIQIRVTATAESARPREHVRGRTACATRHGPDPARVNIRQTPLAFRR